jgi:tartrate-resistant acid phosphatase type 5
LVGTSIFLVLIALLEFAIALPMLWKFPNYHSYPRFFVIGDWGRDGDYNQTVVADSMARKANLFHPNFIISTGDNFYEAGLVSADDPQFDSSFKDIYSHKELNVPWHVVLGNHDYGETDSPKSGPKGCSHAAKDNDECFFGPAHQLDVRLTARDPRWHCERFFSIPLAGGDVEIFFIDTTPIIRSYADDVWAINRGGVLQQSPEDQIRELEARLAASHASWKLVVGHHPIRTNHRPDHKFEDMVADVEPLLVEHGVQAYFAGHDHNLQHLHDPDSGYHHITSGAGSSIGSGFYGNKHSPFQWPGNGFVAVEMRKKTMRVEYIGVDGDEPLFTIDIPRDV